MNMYLTHITVGSLHASCSRLFVVVLAVNGCPVVCGTLFVLVRGLLLSWECPNFLCVHVSDYTIRSLLNLILSKFSRFYINILCGT